MIRKDIIVIGAYVIIMKINKIHCMDCIEGLKQIEDNSVDCIITDPPYGINYKSNHYKGENPHTPIINDDTLFIPMNELKRVLKPTGAMFIFFSHKVPLVDKDLKNVIIWVKNNWTAGDLYGDFGNQYECIGFIPNKEFKIKGKRYSNIWNFDRLPADKLKHPTQKPKSIIRRIIQVASKEEDIVLDPFMGSGTTAVVSKEMNRKFIGFEIEESYFNIINERLSQDSLSNYTHNKHSTTKKYGTTK